MIGAGCSDVRTLGNRLQIPLDTAIADCCAIDQTGTVR